MFRVDKCWILYHGSTWKNVVNNEKEMVAAAFCSKCAQIGKFAANAMNQRIMGRYA